MQNQNSYLNLSSKPLENDINSDSESNKNNPLNDLEAKKILRLPDIVDDESSVLENPPSSNPLSPGSKDNSRLDRIRRKTSVKDSPKRHNLLLNGPFTTSTPAKCSQFNEKSDIIASPNEKDKYNFNLSFGYLETKSQETVQKELLDDLRFWRQEALIFNLYETAIFWGNKILMLDKNISDAYELAEIYYIAEQSQLGLQILKKFDLVKKSIRGRILASRCYISLGDLTKALEVMGEEYCPPENFLSEDIDEKSIRLQAIDCFVRGKIFFELGHRDLAKKWFLQALKVDLRCYEAFYWLSIHNMITPEDEKKILGESQNFSKPSKSKFCEDNIVPLNSFELSNELDCDAKILNSDSIGPQYKYVKLDNNFSENSKAPASSYHCDKSPLCNSNSLQEKKQFRIMSENNKLHPLTLEDNCDPVETRKQNSNSLLPEFKAPNLAISNNSSEFIKATYKFKISKENILPSEKLLKKTFSITDHWDAIYWKANDLYLKGQLNQSHKLLVELREKDVTNLDCIPLLLTILYELNLKDELIKLDEELYEMRVENYLSIYSSGLIHFIENRKKPALSHFKDCCEKYPDFAPSWIAYGHLSSDSSDKIKAYSTAARLQPDSHEPLIYLGRQHRENGTLSLAEFYLNRSLKLSPYPNPHLANELGLVKYATGEFKDAQKYFQDGLEYLQDQDSSENENILETLWTNLGHSYRKENELNHALLCFQNAHNLNSKSSLALAGLAMISDVLGEPNEYVDLYHKASICDSNNQVIKRLLNRAMFENAQEPPDRIFTNSTHLREHSLMSEKSDFLDSILPPPAFPLPSQRRKYTPISDSATRALGLNTSDIQSMNTLTYDDEILEKTNP